MNSRDAEKRAAAWAAVAYVVHGGVLGVGTGSTVEFFIDALAESEHARPAAAVATSRDTEERLRAAGISVVELAELDGPIPIYVDGADEIDSRGRAVKGGGGAHAREKLVAGASVTWICIVDASKLVECIGLEAPVPLEVRPPKRADVFREVASLGGTPVARAGWLAETGNLLVDVSGLDLSEPLVMEDTLEAIPGVVACGIFARRTADLIVIGSTDGTARLLVPEKSVRAT